MIKVLLVDDQNLVRQGVQALLDIADDIEVFGSTSFGDGRTYIGASAPEKFRESISVTRVAKRDYKIDVKHAVTSEDHSLFFIKVSKGKKQSGSALDVVMKDGKLKCFHEAAVKV